MTTIESKATAIKMSQLQLSQLVGMIRYEFLLQWRRRGLLVVTLALLVIGVGFLLAGREQIDTSRATWVASGVTAGEIRLRVTLSLLPLLWPAFYMIMALMYPIITVETIPIDRQFGVRELFRALPLSTGLYLIGKVLGMWLSLLVGLAVAAVVIGVAWWIVLGPFEVSMYAELWIVACAPMALLTSGLVTLLVAAQPGRRRAIMIGMICTFVIVLSLTVSIMPQREGFTLWQYAHPARPVLFTYYFLGRWGAEVMSVAPSLWRAIGNLGSAPDVFVTLAVGVLELVVVYAAMWWWLSRQDR
jgi:hypothetical protein